MVRACRPRWAENLDHEIGGAVHRLGQGVERARDIEIAAEPDRLDDGVEVAERRFGLGEDVDGAEPRRFARGLHARIGPELALVGVGQLSVRPERQLAGNPELGQGAGAMPPARTAGA